MKTRGYQLTRSTNEETWVYTRKPQRDLQNNRRGYTNEETGNYTKTDRDIQLKT